MSAAARGSPNWQKARKRLCGSRLPSLPPQPGRSHILGSFCGNGHVAASEKVARHQMQIGDCAMALAEAMMVGGFPATTLPPVQQPRTNK